MPVDTELYDLLGVPPSASEDDIKKAYRKKAKEHHPVSYVVLVLQNRLTIAFDRTRIPMTLKLPRNFRRWLPPTRSSVIQRAEHYTTKVGWLD
jgi:hypothetical protein